MHKNSIILKQTVRFNNRYPYSFAQLVALRLKSVKMAISDRTCLNQSQEHWETMLAAWEMVLKGEYFTITF